jgi:Brp/Blh family beta-carotene 15,15'-monooxygenase
MVESELNLLTRTRSFSRYSIIFGIVVATPLSFIFPNEFGWQVALATLALVVGIPHGAVDHIITVPKMASLKMAGFLAGYLAVTGLAIWFFLLNPILGFQLIVVVSALHFGVGDASFISEIRNRLGQPKFPKFTYAVAAGFTPVMIPLLVPASTAALTQVNPELIGFDLGLQNQLLIGFIGISLIAIATMLISGNRQEAIDLGLLLAISLITPPLVAFAFYFGFWHALRHTGRLTLELESAKKQHLANAPGKALFEAVLAGLPALAIVVVFTVALGFMNGFDLAGDLLWYLLVVIWALTVPHMMLTARLDAKAMGITKKQNSQLLESLKS